MTKLTFPSLNRAYRTSFQPQKLTLGLVVPIEAHGSNAVPTLERHIERVQLADRLGFAAVWLRDVPFNVPSFGDAGQTFDPFVYLGHLSAVTQDIALGVASIILPLRHPAHVAKAAASADQLSDGRLLLGIASGDRPQEYPAMGMGFDGRGERFRDSVDYIRAMAADYPDYQGPHGVLQRSMDMLPKPMAGRIPLLITGGAQQSPDWVAAHGDGWMTYPRSTGQQAALVSDYRAKSLAAGTAQKPVLQSLYVNLMADPDAEPRPIHLGFQSGVNFLKSYLEALQTGGINHVALNLRFNDADVEDTLARIAEHLLPLFPTHKDRS